MAAGRHHDRCDGASGELYRTIEVIVNIIFEMTRGVQAPAGAETERLSGANNYRTKSSGMSKVGHGKETTWVFLQERR